MGGVLTDSEHKAALTWDIVKEMAESNYKPSLETSILSTKTSTRGHAQLL